MDGGGPSAPPGGSRDSVRAPRCHSDAAAAMAGPAPLLPAEAEALVRALQGTELRDTGGQGCEGWGGAGGFVGDGVRRGEGPGSGVSPEGLSGGMQRRGLKFGLSPLGLCEVGEEEGPRFWGVSRGSGWG